MATTRGQRLGIWVIVGAMMVGTIGGFIAMMVAPANEAKDRAALEAAHKEFNEKQKAYQQKVDAQATSLSAKYFASFSPHAGRASAFDASVVKELTTEDLAVGEGEEVKADTKIAAYYIGWNPKGEVFDQSIDGDKLKAPLMIHGPAKAPVIEGWREGLIGMRVGGIRQLTIPAAKAYGESGSGDKIPANTPLRFVIMAIPQPEEIPQPEIPEIIKREYRRYGIGS